MLKKFFSGNHAALHWVAFLMMILPPLPLYFAARSNITGWIWLLLGLVVAGNLLALVLP